MTEETLSWGICTTHKILSDGTQPVKRMSSHKNADMHTYPYNNTSFTEEVPSSRKVDSNGDIHLCHTYTQCVSGILLVAAQRLRTLPY